eukprot:5868505-Prymnesium_polylepis.1
MDFDAHTWCLRCGGAAITHATIDRNHAQSSPTEHTTHNQSTAQDPTVHVVSTCTQWPSDPLLMDG